MELIDRKDESKTLANLTAYKKKMIIIILFILFSIVP